MQLNIVSHATEIAALKRALADTPYYNVVRRVKIRRRLSLLQYVESNVTAFYPM